MTLATAKHHHIKTWISPHRHDAVIFDLDGVLTQTAKVHAAAWKALFDSFLEKRAAQDGVAYQPFDAQADYLAYVDGKPRYEGVRSFLASRGIHLPEGTPEDSAKRDTIFGLGNQKNDYFQQQLNAQGVAVYESTLNLIQALKQAGIQVALISASKNCALILEKAGLTHLFPVTVDGVKAQKLGLVGKPAPDVFLEAARQLGVFPERAVIVEDAVAGVQAGRSGGFSWIIGVNRGAEEEGGQQERRLQENGADVVVADLAEVGVGESSIFMEVERGEAELGFTRERRDDWRLSYHEFDPDTEGLRESLCALGNGYFVTRAAASEAVDDAVHYPGTYCAGLYNRLTTEVAGKKLEHEELVNLPNWLAVSFKLEGGEWFNLKAVEILTYQQTLDLRQGVLYRFVRFRDAQNRVTRLEERRLVHMRYCHLAAQEVRLTAENWSGPIRIRLGLDGRVINNNVTRYQYLNKKHLQPVMSEFTPDGLLHLKMQTSQSAVQIAQAAKIRLRWDSAKMLHYDCDNIQEPDYIAQEIQLDLPLETPLTLEKTVSLFTSRDPAISEPGLEACEAIRHAAPFEELLNTQAEAWDHIWRLFDINIETVENNGEIPTALILHLHIFHFLQTASPNSVDLDIGIPARGWHGEGYQGHIFWDDMYMFPFLNLRKPEITEALLKYRYRRLEMARRRASAEGLRGASFPWQSGSNGREETMPFVLEEDLSTWRPDNTWKQKHVNASIAYNIWQYYQVTGDIEFLNTYGAEIILEIARLFASLTSYNVERGRYEIKGVMGPDEYHDAYPGSDEIGINNNAYTNIMAVWVLCRALDVLDVLPADQRENLSERLDLHADELLLWNDISRKMYIEIQSNGIINQFEGYGDLMEFPENQSVESVLAESGATLNAYKMSKQADLMMLFYVFSAEELQDLFERLNYSFDPANIPKNIDYYMGRTAHNSTLSRVVAAWVVSRTYRQQSWSLFREALQSDVADIQGGTTQEGIHMGAMAGTVDIIQRCYTGLVMRDNVLWLNPCLPYELTRMGFCIHYRNQSLRLELSRERLRVMARYSGAEPIQIGFRGEVHTLHAGEMKEFPMPVGACIF